MDAITNKVNNAYQKEYSSLNQCKNQAMQSIEAELQVLDAQEIVCIMIFYLLKIICIKIYINLLIEWISFNQIY